mgnify:CR=1 FL=1
MIIDIDMDMSMNMDEKYMRMALDEAMAALEADEVPIGAVVVTPRGMVAGRGHNLTEALGDVSAHAEMQALTAAASALGGKYLQGCTLYVTVEPCLMCAGAIGWAQVSRVVFGRRMPSVAIGRFWGGGVRFIRVLR